MISLSQLWIPIIGSSVVVFVLSSLIHTVLKWHEADYLPLPNEDEIRAVINRGSPAAGQYVVPHCPDMKTMTSEQTRQKFVEGPVGFVVLRRPGAPTMGPALASWFVYLLVVGVFAAYIASRTLPLGTSIAGVFRLIATVAFLTYGGGSVQAGIWMGKPWSAVARDVLDAVLYAIATGLVFGYAYPH